MGQDIAEIKDSQVSNKLHTKDSLRHYKTHVFLLIHTQLSYVRFRFRIRRYFKMSHLVNKVKNFVSDKFHGVAKPEASVADVEFQRATMNSVEYLAKVAVDNPYSHSLPICEVNYSFKSDTRYYLSFISSFLS